jgi:hypothetical protein
MRTGKENNLNLICFFPIENFVCSDGTISLKELADFLFTEDDGEDTEAYDYEPGIIFDVSRQARILFSHLSNVFIKRSLSIVLRL